MSIIESEIVKLHPRQSNKVIQDIEETELEKCQEEFDIIEFQEISEITEISKHKSGPKAKKLVAVQRYGYEVGRGITRRIVIPDEVYKLAALGSTDVEIARWFGIDEKTLRYNFREMLDMGREEMKQSLRQAQMKLALNGNAVMLIWLGKNILGQSDNPVDSVSNKPLPWNDD